MILALAITPGYYLNPEENQKAFSRDGWFNTGDAGVINDGCLTIAARIKDEIIINGVNHLAAEIEAVAETVTGVVVSFTAACAVRRGDSDTDALAIFFIIISSQRLRILLFTFSSKEQTTTAY